MNKTLAAFESYSVIHFICIMWITFQVSHLELSITFPISQSSTESVILEAIPLDIQINNTIFDLVGCKETPKKYTRGTRNVRTWFRKNTFAGFQSNKESSSVFVYCFHLKTMQGKTLTIFSLFVLPSCLLCHFYIFIFWLYFCHIFLFLILFSQPWQGYTRWTEGFCIHSTQCH